MEEFVLDERKCLIIERGKATVTFIVPQMSEHFTEQTENLGNYFLSYSDYRIVAFEIKNWDSELTPWSMELNGRNFGAEGKKTLDFLEKLIIILRLRFPETSYYIAGYSLAGVFALYSTTQSQFISGAVSASGSLWYRDFVEFIVGNMPDYSKVYLSLGDKEEKTKHEIMKTIGAKTIEAYEGLKAKGVKCTLVMNPGGHFNEPDKRLFLGMKWILDNQ